jgi:hypothetical protein
MSSEVPKIRIKLHTDYLSLVVCGFEVAFYLARIVGRGRSILDF